MPYGYSLKNYIKLSTLVSSFLYLFSRLHRSPSSRHDGETAQPVSPGHTNNALGSLSSVSLQNSSIWGKLRLARRNIFGFVFRLRGDLNSDQADGDPVRVALASPLPAARPDEGRSPSIRMSDTPPAPPAGDPEGPPAGGRSACKSEAQGVSHLCTERVKELRGDDGEIPDYFLRRNRGGFGN